jgi:hypothetical protein
LLDGVFIADNGSPVFHPLTHLDDSDLADLLQVIRVRLVNFLLRRGVIEGRDGDAEEWLKNHTVAVDLDPLSLLCRFSSAPSLSPRALLRNSRCSIEVTPARRATVAR